MSNKTMSNKTKGIVRKIDAVGRLVIPLSFIDRLDLLAERKKWKLYLQRKVF